MILQVPQKKKTQISEIFLIEILSPGFLENLKTPFFVRILPVFPELPALPEPGKPTFIENFFGFFLNSEKKLIWHEKKIMLY